MQDSGIAIAGAVSYVYLVIITELHRASGHVAPRYGPADAPMWYIQKRSILPPCPTQPLLHPPGVGRTRPILAASCRACIAWSLLERVRRTTVATRATKMLHAKNS